MVVKNPTGRYPLLSFFHFMKISAQTSFLAALESSFDDTTLDNFVASNAAAVHFSLTLPSIRTIPNHLQLVAPEPYLGIHLKA